MVRRPDSSRPYSESLRQRVSAESELSWVSASQPGSLMSFTDQQFPAEADFKFQNYRSFSFRKSVGTKLL